MLAKEHYEATVADDISIGEGLAALAVSLAEAQVSLEERKREFAQVEIDTRAEIMGSDDIKGDVKKLGPNAPAQEQEMLRRIGELKLSDGTAHYYHVVRADIEDYEDEIRMIRAYLDALEYLRRQEESDRKLRLQTEINLLKDWELTGREMDLLWPERNGLDERCVQLRTLISDLRS